MSRAERVTIWAPPKFKALLEQIADLEGLSSYRTMGEVVLPLLQDYQDARRRSPGQLSAQREHAARQQLERRRRQAEALLAQAAQLLA